MIQGESHGTAPVPDTLALSDLAASGGEREERGEERGGKEGRRGEERRVEGRGEERR